MNEPASASFSALGTTALVLTTDGCALDRAVGLLRDEIEAMDSAASRFRDDSELMSVNRAGGRPVGVSGLFLEAIETALRIAATTGGAVDPTVGRAMRLLGYDRDFSQITDSRVQLERVNAAAAVGWQAVEVDRAAGTVRVPDGVELDLGATAKALCADRAAAAIGRELRTGCLVSLGGDIATAGRPPSEGWLVRVTDDHSAPADAEGQTVSLAGGGLATSSTTVRRWRTVEGAALHHIVDPSTGEPAAEVWRTVTVTAASCVDANAASTSAIVRGESARSWLEKNGVPSRLVRPSGQVELTGGWPSESSSTEAA
jgi:FAD:protein FMN transferase